MGLYVRAACITFLSVELLVSCQIYAQHLNDLFDLKRPSQLGVTLFAGSYANEQVATTHEGVELEQTLTPYVNLVGAASSYHFWKGTGGYESPLSPAPKGAPRNFGRFQGGLDLLPFQGTSLIVLGGEEVGDSHAPVVEGILSSWLYIHSKSPVNSAFDVWHYYQNGVTSGTYNIRTIAFSTGNFLLLAGIGGAIWGGGGGSLAAAKTHGGLDLGVFIPRSHLEIRLQVGSGSAHTYGIIAVSRHFSWEQ
jgi:hypothetical protein